jgi:hypothetical protein
VDVSIEYSSPSPSGKIDMASIQRKLASLQQLRRQGHRNGARPSQGSSQADMTRGPE